MATNLSAKLNYSYFKSLKELITYGLIMSFSMVHVWEFSFAEKVHIHIHICLGKFSIFLSQINLLFPREADVTLFCFWENMQYQDFCKQQGHSQMPALT